jgi:conjugative transfer signal peptidase TraF
LTETVRKWGLALFFLLGTTILLKAYDAYVPWGVRYVRTPSIPTGLYVSKTYDRATPLMPGQVVCFHPTMPAWAADRGYVEATEATCKQVLGVPGDAIEPRGDDVFICRKDACTHVGAVLRTDRSGKPSQPAFTQATVIPPGHYYLGATHHPRSFDSRYLGLVKADSVLVRAWPLLTP